MSKFSVELKIGGNWNNGVTYIQQATIIVDGRTLKEVEEKAITIYCEDILKQYGETNNLEAIYNNIDKTTEATCSTCDKCVCEWSITARARRMKKDESYTYARNYTGVRHYYNGLYNGYTQENICYIAFDPEYNKAEPKAEETEATAETTETTEATAETTETANKRQPDTAERGITMKNYEVKAIIETGAECADIIPDDTEIMADSVEEAVDCVISDLMEQAAYSDYNAERYDNYKMVIYDQNNNVICVYKFKARLTFDNKEIEGAEWEEPEYCDTVTDTTEEAKKDISKKYEAEGLTEAGQWVPLFNDLIDNAETDTDALHVAHERMLKKGLDVSVRVRAYYYNRITGEGCYSHSWTEQPKAEETAQTAEATAEITEETAQTAETTAETTEATTQPTETQTTETTAETTEAKQTTEETEQPEKIITMVDFTSSYPNKAMLNSCYGMCVTAPPPAEATGQPAEETTQATETTEATTQTTRTEHPTETGQPAETKTTGATTQTTRTTPPPTGATPPPTGATPPPPEATGEEVTGVTILEYRTYNNGDKVIIKHRYFYNADEIIDNYHATDPSYICKYKGLMFGKDDNDYYVSEFHYEEQYL